MDHQYPLTERGLARSIIGSNGWPWLVTSAEQLIDDLKSEAFAGAAITQEEYFTLRGRVEGVRQLLHLIEAVADKDSADDE